MLCNFAVMAAYPMLSNAIEGKHRAARCWELGDTPHPLHTRTARSNWRIHPAWMNRFVHLFWSATRSAVLHHIYFGVRLAPLFCIIFILECDSLRCFASYLFWSATRSAVLHHIYFGVRLAPLFCIIFILECDSLCCFASYLFWSATRSAVLHHIYFGVRLALLFCIIFILECDSLCCFASYLF